MYRVLGSGVNGIEPGSFPRCLILEKLPTSYASFPHRNLWVNKTGLDKIKTYRMCLATAYAPPELPEDKDVFFLLFCAILPPSQILSWACDVGKSTWNSRSGSHQWNFGGVYSSSHGNFWSIQCICAAGVSDRLNRKCPGGVKIEKLRGGTDVEDSISK